MAITPGRPARYANFTWFCPMPLAATRAFQNLRPSVFGNHPLELQKPLIFRGA
ncbi:MAG: hypothetical protein ACRERU_06380 [Methylococcales bacterium]